jgi:hypothetical protein
MKLAPEFHAVPWTERLRQYDQCQGANEWQAAIEKVYGPQEGGIKPHFRPLPEPRIAPARKRRCEELATRRALFLEMASLAVRNYHVSEDRQLTLTRLANLIDVAQTLGRLTLGMKLEPGPMRPRV